jgi:hypothetical protein
MDANDPICGASTTTIEKKSYPLTTLLTPPIQQLTGFFNNNKISKKKMLEC